MTDKAASPAAAKRFIPENSVGYQMRRIVNLIGTEVERRMDDAHLNYENTPGNAQIAKLRRLRGGIAREEFLSELSSTIREMRDNYRTNLGG